MSRPVSNGIDQLNTIELQIVQGRFWQKVARSTPDVCWPWTSGKFWDGYGRFKINLKNCRAHKVAYELTYGAVAGELYVLHTCHNKACCNPSHLRLGTQVENMIDAVNEGTIPGMKLGAQQIIEIRASNKLQKETAADFDITQAHVSSIKTGRRWGHIT